MKESMIQVGMNLQEGVVKLRAPDAEKADAFVVQHLSPTAALALAEWLDDGVPSKKLRITDGRRWVECELPPETARKIAADLRACAQRISGA
jgi:hypothetical protein